MPPSNTPQMQRKKKNRESNTRKSEECEEWLSDEQMKEEKEEKEERQEKANKLQGL